MMSVFWVINLSLPNCYCLQEGDLQQRWAIPFSPPQWHCLHPLQQSFFQCYNSCSRLFLASVTEEQQRNTDRAVLGCLSDLLGPRAWKLSFLLRQFSRSYRKKYKKQDFNCCVSKDSYFQIRHRTSLIHWNTFCKPEFLSFPSSLWHLSHWAASVVLWS